MLIDADGKVRHASSVGPAGKRDMEELLALCEKLDKEYEGKLAGECEKCGVPDGTKLYVRSNCGPSRAVLAAVTNLHLEKAVVVANVSEDATAKNELKDASGKETAPCLILDGSPLGESEDIIKELVTRRTGLWS